MHFATSAAVPGPLAVGTSIGEWGIGYGTAHEAPMSYFIPSRSLSLHILQNAHKIHKMILGRLANLPYLDAVQNLVAEVVAVKNQSMVDASMQLSIHRPCHFF